MLGLGSAWSVQDDGGLTGSVQGGAGLRGSVQC